MHAIRPLRARIHRGMPIQAGKYGAEAALLNDRAGLPL
ncbi:hypothetical protein SAMN05216588_102298 [Pseudomonas flavescens]|uniref:Uncharacterized protein n=1 Tax=Phytopseudomonas flavescens TaxID=29435 RepID=A0A1G7ZCW8_9GAMM|nr:hypothetical protein SAMN05216588_102298 [Pseudomonas flavescens]